MKTCNGCAEPVPASRAELIVSGIPGTICQIIISRKSAMVGVFTRWKLANDRNQAPPSLPLPESQTSTPLHVQMRTPEAYTSLASWSTCL